MSTKTTASQKRILDVYVRLVERLGLHPTISELTKAGVTRNKARHHFGTLEDLRKAAKEHKPSVFKNIIDSELFTPKKFQELKDEAKNYRRFIVTTAVTGCKVHKGFLASIRQYCEKNDAMLLVLTATDPAAVVSRKMFIDPLLKDEYIVFGDLALNRKIFISSIKLSAKHIDPITGLSRIGQRNGSFIYASPKQRLKMTPTSNLKLPHAMMTTGAITLADYSTERYMSDRTAYISTHDHVLGAVIVEIQSDKRYHFTQVQADINGNFADRGILWTPTGAKEYAPELIVLPDLHSGETDATAKACMITNSDSITLMTKVRRAVIHDGFNGMSISHHECKNKILRAIRANGNQISLEAELAQYARDLDEIADYYDEVIVSLSNHDEFLHRYLSDGRYADEPQNHLIGLKLAQAMIEGHNPVKYGVELAGLRNKDKIRWLSRDEDFKIAGIECGAHGDKGANGAKGSLIAMENAYGNSVSAHAHTPEILRGAWRVGTMSILKPVYTVGPSSWMHTAGLVYGNGMRQLINVIDGRWRVPSDGILVLDGEVGNFSKQADKKNR